MRANRRRGDEAVLASTAVTEEPEDQFRLLVESFRDSAIVRLDADGRVASWDDAAERLLGWRAAEIVGAGLAPLYTEEDRARGVPEADLAAARAGVHQAEGWRVRADGSLLWASIALMPIGDPRAPSGFSCVIRDITQRKQAEEELRETEEGFRLLVEGVKDYAIFILDPDGRVASWNAGAERMKGYRASDVIGRHCSLFYRRDDVERGLPQAHLRTALAEGRCESEGWRVRLDGSLFWAHVTLSPLRRPDGRLRGFSSVTRDATERRRFEEELAHRALHDGLTGLPNRDLFLDRVAQALARARRDEALVAVLFLDVDRFKDVNDSMGHPAGDRLLVSVAARVRDTVRAEDTVARFGGDEFVVLCDRVSDEAEATAVAQRIVDALDAPLPLDDTEVVATASVGVAVAGAEGTADSLVRDADAAMYAAKARGKARWEVFDDSMRARAAERLLVERDLRRALRDGELCVRYQPQVAIATGELTGVEALVRWEHPARGLVGPSEFIPLAEEAGLIAQIGEFVLADACRLARTWHDAGRAPRPLKVSVNLSPVQITRRDVVDRVRAAIEHADVDPTALCLEITESVLIGDATAGTGMLVELKDLGVELAIDDFGTGYSSLSYLHRFPVTSLKIDSSFVEGVDRGGSEGAIVAAMISMAHALGIAAVAEGVETDAQLAALRELGCDVAQGFLFAPAVPAGELGAIARRLAPAVDVGEPVVDLGEPGLDFGEPGLDAAAH